MVGGGRARGLWSPVFWFKATDGTMMQGTGTNWNGRPLLPDGPNGQPGRDMPALVSAVHDLPCGLTGIIVVARFDEDNTPKTLEGCGQRVTYEIVHEDNYPTRMLSKLLLTGRVPLTPGTPPSTPAPQ
jgi:hypothetical protein